LIDLCEEVDMTLRKPPVAAFVALALAISVLSGCIKIQVIDRSPAALPDRQVLDEASLEEHDLSILAVDFDPPLVYEKIVARRNRGEGITLLVAIENTGLQAEQFVTVQVELSGADSEESFLQKEGSIEVIAPGEIKIVHFEDAEIPFSYQYFLRVYVEPVPGETKLDDNLKGYDLLLSEP
jgi:hypothetical protein